MDILAPPRLNTFQPRTLRVVIHTATEQNVLELHGVFPFETVFDLKQRIAVANDSVPDWLPTKQFIATAAADGMYTPIEFTWPFAAVLPDPFHPSTFGKADPRIYEEGARKSVFPTFVSAVTLETLLEEDAPTLHVWTLNHLVRRASNTGVVSNELFDGFLRLYFPMLRNSQNATNVVAATNTANILKTYRDVTEARLKKLETLLGATAAAPATPFRLKELRSLRYALPLHTGLATQSLLLLFHERKPTERLPFLRFFPADGRSAPIMKLATHATTGAPVISDQRVLSAFLADQPATVQKLGDMLVLKAPVKHPRAPLGTCWTIRLFEDGSAELHIGAPRRDTELHQSVVATALQEVGGMLEDAGWRADSSRRLTEISATYEFASGLRKEKSPSKSELRARYEVFAPLFLLDTIPVSDNAAVSLRYRAVSNYTREIDPVAAFISHLFLREQEADVATELVRAFGMTPVEVERAVDAWDAKYRELIVTRDKKVVAAHSAGALAGIVNRHPSYEFVLAGVESELDLLRILASLALYVSNDAATLQSTAAAAAAAEAPSVTAAAPETTVAVAAAEAEEDAGNFMEYYAAYGENEEGGEEAAAEETAAAPAAAAPAAAAPAPAPAPAPLLGTFGDDILPQFEYLERLHTLDPDLFAYTVTDADKRYKVYSRCCQKSSNKQPNVLTPESYENAYAIYGDAVFWVEAPLSPEDAYATQMAARTPGEREKMLRAAKKSANEMLALELRALRLGFPLKEDAKNGIVSISEITDKKGPKYPFSDVQLEELRVAKEAQKTKPLWVVVRAGSLETRPNYYICAEYWCVHNDLPLIPSEFYGTKSRIGNTTKPPYTCPFCKGTLLENPDKPMPGQTVLRREVTSGGKSIAKYAGYLSTIQHPDAYPLPCCFASPDSLNPPVGSQPVPAPAPMFAAPSTAATAAPPPSATVEAPAAAEEAEGPVVAERIEMPFSPTTFTTAASGKRVQNRMYIPSQIVLGRTTLEWFELEKGAVAVPPPAVNTLLGQNPEQFLTKNKGAMAEKINSKLAVPATAFVRYGIGASKRTPGAALLALIAFAKYSVEEFKAPSSENRIVPAEEIIEELFGQQAVPLAHAFEQANYGTLVHEFSRPDVEFPEARDGEFLEWCKQLSIRLDSGQRPYAQQLFLAWRAFQDYVRDVTVPKELRLWEGLFATPGLLTPTGCVLVRIVIPKDAPTAPRIHCPEFGIPSGVRELRPPLLFVLEDEQTGLYDPLVFYDGQSETEKHILGVLSDRAPTVFDRLSAAAREPLQAFLAQYFSDTEGCGRSASDMHPWMPERDVDRVPRLGELYRTVRKHDVRIESLLRDRSNRLVGVLVRAKPFEKSPVFYIPARDDGTVLPHIPSHRGEEALPLPPLDELLYVLGGGQIKVSEKVLGHSFPGLLPARLIANKDAIVAVDLRCGATVPVAPIARTASVKSVWFTKLKRDGVDLKEDMPWNTDIALLGPAAVAANESTAAVREETEEEQFEEAYQHLRVSLSAWLNGTAEGQAVRQQIELLRKARTRLPLFELQKRLDILLTPFVAKALTAAGQPHATLLRKDCLQIKAADGCDGVCSWSGGRCLIHAAGTERYMNPVRVMTARLTDEFLRTFGAAMALLKGTVSRLRPMKEGAVLEEDGSVLFAGHGRSDESLFDALGYSKRKVGPYTQGFVYPEEVDLGTVAAEEAASTARLGALPPEWAATVRYPVFAAEVARDPLQRFSTVLLALLGKPAPPTFRGTRKDWADIGQMLGAQVVLTATAPNTGLLVPIDLLESRRAGGAAAGAPAYILVDATGVPLQNVRTEKYTFAESDLPASLRAWIDAHGA